MADSKKLWKHIPTEKTRLKPTRLQKYPIIEEPSLHCSEEAQIMSAYDFKKQKEANIDINETAKFGVSQFQSLIKSQKFEKMVNDLISSNDMASSGSPFIQRNKKFSLGFGNNLVLSISNNSGPKNTKQLLQVKEKLKEVRILYEEIKTCMNQLKNQFQQFLIKIALHSEEEDAEKKKQIQNAKIQELEQDLQNQKILSQKFKTETNMIVLELQNIMQEMQGKQNKNQLLEKQIQKLNSENKKLSEMIKELSSENEQLQQSIFGYKQKSVQFDLQMEEKIREFMNGKNSLANGRNCIKSREKEEQINRYQEEMKVKEKQLEYKWKMLEEMELKLDTKINDQYDQILHNRRIGSPQNEQYCEYTRNPSNKKQKTFQESPRQQKKSLVQYKSLDKLQPYYKNPEIADKYNDKYNQRYNGRYNDRISPKAEATGIKLANLRMRLIQNNQSRSKAENSKYSQPGYHSPPVLSKNRFQPPSSPNKLSFLQNKIQSLKKELRRQIQQAK